MNKIEKESIRIKKLGALEDVYLPEILPVTVLIGESASGNHLDAYAKKVALFSCRLSDKTGNGPMARSARAFNSTIRMLEHMRLHEYLGHGFVFEMRVYNKEYRLQND